MPRWWNVGFVTVFAVTVAAQLTHWALLDPSLTGEHVQAASDRKAALNLTWDWASDDIQCTQFDMCVHIAVDQTNRCEDQLAIDVSLTDKKDNWVDIADMVVSSPRQPGSSVVEVGVNRDDFEYFMVGEVRCITSVPSAEADL